jgi:hypothetical protein
MIRLLKKKLIVFLWLPKILPFLLIIFLLLLVLFESLSQREVSEEKKFHF